MLIARPEGRLLLLGEGKASAQVYDSIEESLHINYATDMLLWWAPMADAERRGFVSRFARQHPVCDGAELIDPLIYRGRVVNVAGAGSSLIGPRNAYDLELDPRRAVLKVPGEYYKPAPDDGLPFLDMTRGIRWCFGRHVLAALASEEDHFGIAS